MKFVLIPILILLAGCSAKTDIQNDASMNIADSGSDDLALKSKDLSDLTDDATKQQADIGMDTKGCGDAEVVKFKTSDNVELVADYHPPKEEGKGAVVLVHMIPPSNDRSTYPPRVRNAFSNQGLAVLNLDRRGAGDSSGIAKDAYQGPKGVLDVEAAVEFLLSKDRKCRIDANKLMLVGASNGTTSIMDYSVGRSTETLPLPKTLVWLSPGTYTETQHKIEEHKTLLSQMPLLIIHPENETWIEPYIDFSEHWRILKLQDGKHGTQNFDDGALEAQQLPALADWANTHLGD